MDSILSQLIQSTPSHLMTSRSKGALILTVLFTPQSHMQCLPLKLLDQKCIRISCYFSYMIDILSFRRSRFVHPNTSHEEYILFTSSISILLRDSDMHKSKYMSYRFVLKNVNLYISVSVRHQVLYPEIENYTFCLPLYSVF
jgi:hypothetical protein